MIALGDAAFRTVQTSLARAARHEVPTVGTDYLLSQVQESVGEQLDGAKATAQPLGGIWRIAIAVGWCSGLSGGLGAEPSWRTSTETIADLAPASPAVHDLREAVWMTHEMGRPLVPWTKEYLWAVENAFECAHRRGGTIVSLSELALSLLGDPSNRAAEGLTHAKVDVDSAAEQLRAASTQDALAWAPALPTLVKAGAFTDVKAPRKLFGRKPGPTVTIGTALAQEAVRQAARSGDSTVALDHLRLALLAVRGQAAAAGYSWGDPGGIDSLTAGADDSPRPWALPESWPSIDQDLPRRISAESGLAGIVHLL